MTKQFDNHIYTYTHYNKLSDLNKKKSNISWQPVPEHLIFSQEYYIFYNIKKCIFFHCIIIHNNRAP